MALEKVPMSQICGAEEFSISAGDQLAYAAYWCRDAKQAGDARYSVASADLWLEEMRARADISPWPPGVTPKRGDINASGNVWDGSAWVSRTEFDAEGPFKEVFARVRARRACEETARLLFDAGLAAAPKKLTMEINHAPAERARILAVLQAIKPGEEPYTRRDWALEQKGEMRMWERMRKAIEGDA